MAIPLEKYGQTFAKYVRGVQKAYLAPFEGNVREARTESSQAILSSDLGKNLWTSSGGERKSSPSFLVSNARFSVTKSGAEGLFKIEGMAALMVTGGRTSPKKILSRRGKFMRFDSGAEEVFASEVNHPGSRVNRIDVVQPILEKRATRFKDESIRSLDQHAKESFR